MRCPYCGVVDGGVLESRLADDDSSVRRRRICNRCHKRFTTYERVETLDMVVIKKGGRKEVFDREKLKRGLIRATWKRSVSMAEIEKLIDDVERKLRLKKSTQFESRVVGRLVLNRLKALDVTSYLAFASVYYNYTSMSDYQKALGLVEKTKEQKH